MGSIVSSGSTAPVSTSRGIVQKLVEAEGAPKTLRLERGRGEGPGQALGARLAALGARELSRLGREAQRHRRTSRAARSRCRAPDFLTATATSTRRARQLRGRGRAARAARTSFSRSPRRVGSDGRRHGHAARSPRAADLRRRHRRDEQHGGRDRGRDQRSAAGAKVVATVDHRRERRRDSTLTARDTGAANAHHDHAERRRRRPRGARISAVGPGLTQI